MDKAPLKLQKYYFKMVAKIGDKYFSIFDGKTEYVLGQIMHEPASSHHGGGYYVYPTMKQAVFADVPHTEHGLYMAPRTILVCICWGDSIQYSNGKIAFSYISPVKELPLHKGYLATKTARKEADDLKVENKKKGTSVILNNMKEKVISHSRPSSAVGKKVSGSDPLARKQVLDKKTGSDLLKDENNLLEREILEMEKRLQGIVMFR